MLTVDGQCQFIDCNAYSTAGGLYAFFYNSSSKLVLEDCLFRGCYSLHQSGGSYIYNQGALLVNRVIFENCSCDSDYSGGMDICIHGESIQCIINGTSFINCRGIRGGAYSGGAIYIDSGQSNEISTIHFISQTQILIENCSASWEGGGISCFLTYNSSQASFSNITFNNCSASGDGGGMYVNMSYNCEIELFEQCIFNNCIAQNGGAIYFEVIYCQKAQINSYDILIEGCQAISNITSGNPTGFGGAIFLAGFGDYDISSNGFNFRGVKTYNNAASNGGQSLFVVMAKLQEWCQYGDAGEYVKGNYSRACFRRRYTPFSAQAALDLRGTFIVKFEKKIQQKK
ncbi:MAG: hypothetical protein EZS28_017541 [Streblomastix strix]|uniref:Right handed beta helix domain-containing protein n=1 Tax=Streblomastix strix TaxID=222440 RepID=A0A5J4VWQ2_9EUKA|nr:MAG: hypothetical protein EZS28_017541 [Streblomastix strix]